MREDREESAIYLCGTRIDNVFCSGSNDIRIAISVLPQDGQIPSGLYHPENVIELEKMRIVMPLPLLLEQT